jgi:D-alanyl-D-alanine carboxypeptidase
VLGYGVYTRLLSHQDMRAVAATRAVSSRPAASMHPSAHPAISARPSASASPAASATPSPSPAASIIAVPSQLPAVAVPLLHSNWLRTHPIAETPAIKARAAVVVDLTAGQILFQQDATSRYADASLTKMMTAMVAADLAPMDTVITVPDAATQVEPNHMGISTGEQLTLRQLIQGMMLDSGNDAAEAIAMGMVDRDSFLNLMNAKAAQLQLRQTHFTNPSGLDDPNHFSSAYDLTVISATLLNDYPQLRAIVGSKAVSIPSTSQHKAFDPTNIDRLLWTYPGAIGIKPGYTPAAGYCLAAAATRNGRTMLVVVLGSTQHFTDAATLLDFAFRHPAK